MLTWILGVLNISMERRWKIQTGKKPKYWRKWLLQCHILYHRS